MNTFTARLASSFESQPVDERLYEVVTQEGERIASCTSLDAAEGIAERLDRALVSWVAVDPADRVTA